MTAAPTLVGVAPGRRAAAVPVSAVPVSAVSVSAGSGRRAAVVIVPRWRTTDGSTHGTAVVIVPRWRTTDGSTHGTAVVIPGGIAALVRVVAAAV